MLVGPLHSQKPPMPAISGVTAAVPLRVVRRSTLRRCDAQPRVTQQHHYLTAGYLHRTRPNRHLAHAWVQVIVIALKHPVRHTCGPRHLVQFDETCVADQMAPLTTPPPPAALVYINRHAVSDRRSRHRIRHPTGGGQHWLVQRPHRPRRTPTTSASSSGGRTGRWLARSTRSWPVAFRRRHHRSCSGIHRRPWASLYLVACRPLAW
jgi:hypothetical protein